MPNLRRVALDRRALLRGGAACLALPWLDAMLPAMSRPPRSAPKALFVFSPNGMDMARWRQRDPDGALRAGPTLTPLRALEGRVTVFGGLEIDGGKSHGDGPGDHARSSASFLTCAHPRKTGGADLQAGVSVDQAIAQELKGREPFRSLELGLERGRPSGVCDSGYSCAYSNNVSWSAADRPVAKETDPRAVFLRMFGDPRSALDQEQRSAARARQRSILDLVRGDAQALRRELGAADRRKLAQYLDSVRDLEQRLQQGEQEREARVQGVPDGMFDGDGSHTTHLQLMYELIALAFATEQTRVATLMLGNAGSNYSYHFLGVDDGHHALSHHGGVEEKRAQVGRIDRYQVEQLGRFGARLAAEARSEHDLLHESLVVFGSGIGDGNRHNHDDLPMLLLGEGGGAARGRGYVDLGEGRPAADLYLSVMRAMGSQAERFADSVAPLPLR